jgi:hypothetical protein
LEYLTAVYDHFKPKHSLQTAYMKEQNAKNHTRLSSGYHGFTLVLILILLVGSIRYFLRDATTDKYAAALLLLTAVILVLLFFFIRIFALRAQDRAIRAEESLRYFILTGKRLDPSIRIGQIIALRFASDEEFPALVEQAKRDNMDSKTIKSAIRSWRADHHRV